MLQDGRDHAAVLKADRVSAAGEASTTKPENGASIWEDEDRPISAIVNPDNIIAGSLCRWSTDHEGLADEVVGDFTDSGCRNTMQKSACDGSVPGTLTIAGATSGGKP